MDGGLVADGDDAVATLRERLNANLSDITFRRGSEASIQLVTNGRRAMLIWWAREDLDEGLHAVDPDAGDTAVGGFVLANGQLDVYPSSHTVPLDGAIEAVRHAVDHNRPDPRLKWRGW